MSPDLDAMMHRVIEAAKRERKKKTAVMIRPDVTITVTVDKTRPGPGRTAHFVHHDEPPTLAEPEA